MRETAWAIIEPYVSDSHTCNAPQAVWMYSHKPFKEPRMHVKRLEPLRLSGRPPHPHKGLARLSNIVGERQRKFHVRGYVPGIVSGVLLPCSDRVPRYYIQE